MAVLTADSGPAGGGLSVDTAPVATALLERPALNIRTLAEIRIITGPTVCIFMERRGQFISI